MAQREGSMITIVVPWRDRAEFSQTAAPLARIARRVGGELLVVNLGGCIDTLNKFLSEVPDAKIHHVQHRSLFNKCLAQNFGVKLSSHDILFFCDCDVIVSENDLLSLYEQVKKTPNTFGTIAQVKETVANTRKGTHVVKFGYHLLIGTADGRTLAITDHEEDLSTGTRCAPGLLLLRKDDFLAVNGYNSDLNGWGWEDQDMISRLILGRGLQRLSQGQALHVSHSDGVRAQAYSDHNIWDSRDRNFRAALRNYDVGNFLGTYSKDIIELSTLLG
jgi:predicted glycosyltransferase involved in capsule biosynthesis